MQRHKFMQSLWNTNIIKQEKLHLFYPYFCHVAQAQSYFTSTALKRCTYANIIGDRRWAADLTIYSIKFTMLKQN